MRLTVAVLVTFVLPAVAAAQPSAVAPPAAGPLPPIGLPLPPIGLPLPPIGLPPSPEMQPRIGDDRASRGSENGRPTVGSNLRSGAAVVFFVPTYPWGSLLPGQIAPPPPSVPEAAASRSDQPPATGGLRLEIAPAGAQLFVDGQYVGTPEDFNGELELEAGSHAIEIRAPGYETLVVTVKIAPGRTITYRETLKRPRVEPDPRPARAPEPRRIEPPKAPTPSAPAPSTFYFIPGCYLGNVPPEDVRLPATCDLTRLITRKP